MIMNMPLIIISLNITGLFFVCIKIIRYSLLVEKHLDIGVSKTIGDRELQEDQCAYVEKDESLLLAMSDGMGRSFGGKIAATIAVDTSIDLFDGYNPFDTPNYYFRKSYSTINREILQTLDGTNGYASLLNVLIKDDYLYYALVGNIKLFIFRKDKLIEVTYGHTIDMLVNEQYKKGKIKRIDAINALSEKRSYNFIGRDGFYDIEFFDEPIYLKASDIVVIMTDGAIDTLGHKEIEDFLQHNKENMQKASYKLVEKINIHESDEKDNSSIMLIKVKR